MQRYAGEHGPADGRRPTPMVFDGWEYVPLDVSVRAEPENSGPDHSQPGDDDSPGQGDEVAL